jgi:tRNA(fMet)-specific endonuclease VapC
VTSIDRKQSGREERSCAARRYGRLAASLLDRGSPIGVENTMIAAHALSRRLTLVTHHCKHFEIVPGLRVEDWL